jgi:diguanylate cyclase (GGDEF)-like protein
LSSLSQKTLAARYLLTLSLVAILTITSHMIVTKVVATRTSAAMIINTSGRQRMLSQRIASLAVQYNVMGDVGAKADLLAATAEMRENFQTLTRYGEATGVLKTDPAMRALYSAGPVALDVAVPAFIGSARAVAAAPPGDKAVMPQLTGLLTQARSALLNQLNAVTVEWVRHNDLELQKMRDLQTLSLIIVLLTLAAEALGIFRPMLRRMMEYTSELVRLTVIDPLTDVHNRRGFLWRADIELKRTARYGQPLSLLAISVDHFKSIISKHGNPEGDIVLKTLARQFMQAFRASDIIGRWCGEEFVILLPCTSAGAAAMLAERMRAKAANLPFNIGDFEVPVTISIGVAEVEPGALSLDEAMPRAESALFTAKNRGRDRIEMAPSAELVRYAANDG